MFSLFIFINIHNQYLFWYKNYCPRFFNLKMISERCYDLSFSGTQLRTTLDPRVKHIPTQEGCVGSGSTQVYVKNDVFCHHMVRNLCMSILDILDFETRSHHAGLAGLGLRDPPVSVSQVLGLKIWTPPPPAQNHVSPATMNWFWLKPANLVLEGRSWKFIPSIPNSVFIFSSLQERACLPLSLHRGSCPMHTNSWEHGSCQPMSACPHLPVVVCEHYPHFLSRKWGWLKIPHYT